MVEILRAKISERSGESRWGVNIGPELRWRVNDVILESWFSFICVFEMVGTCWL